LGAGAALVNPIASFALLTALAVATEPRTFGIVAMTAAFTGIPVTLLIPSARHLLQQEYSASRDLTGMSPEARLMQHLKQWFPLSCLVVVVGIALGPRVLPGLLGEGWSETSDYVGLLSLASAVQLWVAPTGVIFAITGRLGTQLLLDIIRAALTISAVVIADRLGVSSMIIVALGVAATVAGYLLLLGMAMRAMRGWQQVAGRGTP
jgi:O-antigen/teichoic acid export membrane protein